MGHMNNTWAAHMKVARHYSKMMAKWKTIFESQLQAFLRNIQYCRKQRPYYAGPLSNIVDEVPWFDSEKLATPLRLEIFWMFTALFPRQYPNSRGETVTEKPTKSQ